MSTEIERRISGLERRLFGAGRPCMHATPVLIDPTEHEIELAIEALKDCPSCAGNPLVVAVPDFRRLVRDAIDR